MRDYNENDIIEEILKQKPDYDRKYIDICTSDNSNVLNIYYRDLLKPSYEMIGKYFITERKLMFLEKKQVDYPIDPLWALKRFCN